MEVDLGSGYYQFMVNKLVGRYELFSSSRDVYSRVGLNSRRKTRAVCRQREQLGFVPENKLTDLGQSEVI